MTKEQAYEKLELPIDTDLQVVRQKFQQMHNDFQVQIDGAFNESMRRRKEQQLEELKEAYAVLNKSESMDDSASLPRTEKTFDQTGGEARKQTTQQDSAPKEQHQAPPPPPPRQEREQQQKNTSVGGSFHEEVTLSDNESNDVYAPKSRQVWRHIGLFLAVALAVMTVANTLFFEKPENDLIFHILAVVVSLGILFWLAWLAARKLPIKNTWITVAVAVIFPIFGFLNDFMNEQQGIHTTLHPKEQDGKMGYVNDKEELVIPLRYDWAFPFKDGYAPVSVDGKSGMIDKTGKEVVPIQYDAIDYFSENMAPVMQDGKVGYVNKTGQIQIALEYDVGEPFSEGLAAVGIDGKFGFINADGETVIPMTYEGVSSFSDGLAWVYKNEKFGYIDKKGTLVIPIEYDDVHGFDDGVSIVSKNGVYRIIDKQGKTTRTLGYDIVDEFSNEVAAVFIIADNKWGYINRQGNEIIPLIYDDVFGFNDEQAKVTLDNHTFYINKKGQCVRDCPD